VWRDAICTWFLKMSGIPDANGRAAHFPDRTEAESMELHGYEGIDIVPAENASRGKAIRCSTPAQPCEAAFKFMRVAGTYKIDVQYFDMPEGNAIYRLFVGDKVVDQWVADDHLPARALGGDSSTRHEVNGVVLHPGDEIRIEGTADSADPAALDYISVQPTGRTD
jgi:alpha-glucuronidase